MVVSALTALLLGAKGDDSIDKIAARARAAGHPTDRATIAKYLSGTAAKTPTERVVLALAAGFGLSPQQIREAAGVPAGELGPWRPPAEAGRLSQEQRDALNMLIRAIVRGGRSAGETGAGPTVVRGGDRPATGQFRPRGEADSNDAEANSGEGDPAV